MLHLSSHSCAERPVGPTEIGRRSAASARHCQLESHSGGAADGSRTGWKLTAMVAGQEVSPLSSGHYCDEDALLGALLFSRRRARVPF